MRTILAIGSLCELQEVATLEDIARLTLNSLYWTRGHIYRLKKMGLVQVEKTRGRKIHVKLTEEGLHYYAKVRSVLDPEKKLSGYSLISKFDEIVYGGGGKEKVLGGIEILIDKAIPALKLPELIKGIIRHYGHIAYFGIATNLIHDAELAIQSKLSRVDRSSLTTNFAVIFRVGRDLDVALPPNLLDKWMELDELVNLLSLIALWPPGSKKELLRSVRYYASEAASYGLVNLRENKVGPSPYFPMRGLSVVSEIASHLSAMLTRMPSRAWIPHIAVYGAINSIPMTISQVLNAEHPLLKIVCDCVGHRRYNRWAFHVLGFKRTMKCPSLKDLGIVNIFGDERFIIPLSAARRVYGNVVQDIRSALNKAYRLVKDVISSGGEWGKAARILLSKGLIDKKVFLKNIRLECNIGREEARQIIIDLVKCGLAGTTGRYVFSRWTITPITDESDTIHGPLLLWLHESVDINKADDPLLEVLRCLIERGACDIGDFAGSLKEGIELFTRLDPLRKLDMITFEGTVVKIKSETARKYLHLALVERILGFRLRDLYVEHGDQETLIVTLLDKWLSK